MEPTTSTPTTRIERRPDGELIVVAGTSGSGKTLYTMRHAARDARLAVWDSHLQWWAHGCAPMATIAGLARACGTREPQQLAYTGPVNRENFENFCRIALCWIKLAPATIVVEELADVSIAGKAPQAWGELLRWARKLGATIYGITQRPAESDKTSLRIAHRIICHVVHGLADQKYMAQELGVEISVVQSLDIGKLEYLERGPDHKVRRGCTSRNLSNSRSKSRRA